MMGHLENLPILAQMPNRSTNIECITVSPAIANTFVCVQRSCLCDESRSLDGRSGATLTMKPVVCCVVLTNKVVNDTAGASVRAERTVKQL